MAKKNKYRQAADLIESQEAYFCCSALISLNKNETAFRCVFKPTPEEQWNLVGGVGGSWFGPDWVAENQLARQIALQLMAEMGYK